jgi:RHS repeat-associated protein
MQMKTNTSIPAIQPATNRYGSYSYNEAGAVLSDGTYTFTYDALSQPLSKIYNNQPATQEYYIYTPNDERIGVQRGGWWTWSVRDEGGKVLRQYKSSATDPSAPVLWLEDFVWRDGLLLGSQRPVEMGGRRHVHLDHLGSPRLITSDSGEMVSYHDYYPFGDEKSPIPQEVSGGFDREDPLKFTGHERDYAGGMGGEDGHALDYMHARYHNPAAGRFLSVDPIMPVEAMRAPQLWNRYAYVGNNPVGRVDPTGKVLKFVGGSDDLDKVQKIADSGLNGYQLNIGANGVASLSKVKANGKETKEQKAFRQALQRVIGDKATTAINVASHAQGVVIGQFKMRTIDPVDMQKFGSAQPSASSTLGHEVMEQYAGQVLGMTTIDMAHPWAIQQENTFTGWTRGNQTTTSFLPNGLAYGDVFYSRGKETIDVRVTVDPRTYDVVSVTRTPVP